MEIGPDGRQIVVGQAFAQKEAVGFAACFGFGGECGVGRMWRPHGIRTTAAMGRATRAWIVSRIIRHAGADRIEVNVSLTVKDIAFAVDQAGLVAAFP